MKRTIFFSSALIGALLLSLGLLASCERAASVIIPPMGTIQSRPGMHNPNSLVDVNQLLALMERDDVVLIDFSQEPNQLIPGAVWVNRSLLLRDFEGNTMAPQPLEVHEHVLGHLGISNDHTIVIYCNQHNLWATRLLWQLRAMGHERVKLLDGGTSAWLAAGGTVSNVPSAPRAPVEFRALNRMGFIHADLADVLDAKHNPNWIIIDFRTQPEWDAGRIPSAVQFTFPADIRNADGTFRSAEEVAYLFRDIPRDKRIIVYCAGGTRAASIWFALTDILGWPQRVLLYEGWWNYAWSGLPIEI